MGTKSELVRQLDPLAGFEEPRADREQYRTPTEIAAQLLQTARMQDDLADRVVIDLGCGTGILTLGAALCGPSRVVGIDCDAAALGIARENERRVDTGLSVSWIRGDATRVPLSETEATVIMNPPFGAQQGNEHADRAFLETATALGTVSYSIHNEGSQSFVESFAADNGGRVTHGFRVAFDLPATFAFHSEQSRTIDTELFRIEWPV